MTRRAQFLKAKAKHKRREARMWKNHGSHVPNEVNNTHGGGNKLILPVIGILEPARVSSRTYDGTLNQRTPDLAPEVFGAEGRGKPPHIRITSPLYHTLRNKGWRQRFALYGFHQRRVVRYGRKAQRMSGADRRVWGAALFCIRNNFYPDWDPLGRHPTAADIDNGAAYVDIDWRWGATGNYP